MSLIDAIIFDENISYSSISEETLSDQYDRLVSIGLPFLMNHYQTKNGNRHRRRWYFNDNGELIPKRLYKVEKTKFRRYIRWNPTLVLPGELWTRIIGDVTQSFVSYTYLDFNRTELNSVLSINVNDSISMASFSTGYDSGGLLQLATELDSPPNANVSFGFYCSEDGSDLETTNNYIVVNLATDGSLYMINGQTNEIQLHGSFSSGISNLGILLDTTDGRWNIIDSGYFTEDATTNFVISGKIYPFVKVDNNVESNVIFKLKTEFDTYYDGGFYPETIKHPSPPSMLSLPTNIIVGKKYIVTDANMFSRYQNFTLHINDVVGFDENNNMFVYD